MKTKTRVLFISRNLPPLIGGMERLMLNVARYLANGFDVTVVGPRGCEAHLPEGIKVIEATLSLTGFLFWSFVSGFKAALIRRPDVIIGGSGLQAPTVLFLQIVFRAEGIVFIHGLDVVANNAVYQRLFVPCLRGVRKIIANSHNTMQLAVDRGVQQSRIHVIHPGTDLPELDKPAARNRFREKYGISEQNILLFVGRIAPRKGLLEFVRQSLPGILEKSLSSCLIIVGDEAKDSINQHSPDLKRVIDYADKHGMTDRIHFLGHIDNDSLIDAYAAADVHVFPLVDTPGDVEGFGMVAIEAAACGTPTVAFAVGGVVDSIDDKRSGYLVEPGKYDAFTERVVDILTNRISFSANYQAFAAQFHWDRFDAELDKVIVRR
ncbi:glycosyltransferase family 4 protein [Pseudomonadota bacterium]